MFGLSDLELLFVEALALIAFACLFVPLARAAGLGTIIGYLVAGIAAGLLVGLYFEIDAQNLLQFAEFGVVLFLFVIGLAFRPARLWELRATIFGRGLVQVLATSTVLTAAALIYGLDWPAAIVVGTGLAMSSTALVIRALDEAGERGTAYGQTAIGVLLFEDLSIVPLLLLIALLSPSAMGDMTLADNARAVAIGIGAIVFLVVVAKFALDPMFGTLARSRTPELMTAAALGVVIFATMVMALAGLSYAMGAFIAGVMLAESSYRHQVEADIEPFRGLFLGLFFLAVGMSLNLSVVAENWLLIVIATPILMALKGLAVYGVNRLFGASHTDAMRMGFALAQHGEFGFVLFAAATAAFVIDTQTASIMVSIVVLSMALSSQNERLLGLVMPQATKEQMDEDFADAGGEVLIVGFGRFGQMVAQPLVATGRQVTLLDADANRVREAGRFGPRVYFGDGTRRDVLASAGGATAEIIVVSTDKPDVTDAVVALIQREFPQAKILARAYDRIHAVLLYERGVDVAVRETAAAALQLGGDALRLLGIDEDARAQLLAEVRQSDRTRLDRQRAQVRGAKDRESVIAAIQPQPVRNKQDKDRQRD